MLPDVLRARKVVRADWRPTALLSYPAVDRLLGAQVFVKHANHSPISSFKGRGSLNALSAHTQTPPGYFAPKPRSWSPSGRIEGRRVLSRPSDGAWCSADDPWPRASGRRASWSRSSRRTSPMTEATCSSR